MKKEKLFLENIERKIEKNWKILFEKRGIMINFVVLKLLEKWLELIWLIV